MRTCFCSALSASIFCRCFSRCLFLNCKDHIYTSHKAPHAHKRCPGFATSTEHYATPASVCQQLRCLQRIRLLIRSRAGHARCERHRIKMPMRSMQHQKYF